ncbi:hypothetical protein SCHPADRAFT_945621 [Schizopora paradoxa]|uniref:Uncharacterized protein n=1 Tax=Schizopora paradoxa TaxID=27342 RepID=A0A0H2RC15_9AGAM|nr:hypothetical protein SCHPADRAFT_945621 [Schizopora paradoxa]
MSVIFQANSHPFMLRQINGVQTFVPVNYDLRGGKCIASLQFPSPVSIVPSDGRKTVRLGEDLLSRSLTLTVELEGYGRHKWGIPKGIKKRDVLVAHSTDGYILYIEYPIPPTKTYCSSNLAFEL